MYMPIALYKRFSILLNLVRWAYGLLLVFTGITNLLVLSDLQTSGLIALVSDVLGYSVLAGLSSVVVIFSIQVIAGSMLCIGKFSRWGAYLGFFLFSFLAVVFFVYAGMSARVITSGMLAFGSFLLAQLLTIKDGMRDSAV